MENKINVSINGTMNVKLPVGTSVLEVIEHFKKKNNKCIVGAKIDNLIVDVDTLLYEDTKIEFFDYTDREGYKMYQAGLKFIMIIAVKELWGKEVCFKYSLDKGICAEIDKNLSDENILALKTKMKEIVALSYPIKKCITSRKDAISYYNSTKELEKADNIHNIPNKYVALFKINHTYNFFYTEMPYNTCELGFFDIEKVGKNALVLMYPRIDSDGLVPKFTYNELIYNQLVGYSVWYNNMDFMYVNGVNRIVAKDAKKFIKIINIIMNDSINYIAKEIVKKSKDVKMILIGGPSSSGKTTSAYRLRTFLEAFGLKPIVISADDYFVEREDTPKDENGNYDFECLEAIDLNLFNKHLKKLLKGEEVVIPKFNFVLGKKEYTRKPIKMERDNVLLVEGIHCLNEEMTKSIKRENKYKVFVCPLTSLGLDRHNHLSTTDMRLIRRIVRDNRTRGRSVEETLKNFTSVKAGEEKYIFPYTKDADAVLNTAYAYELGVLRVFAEPLLYRVPVHSVYYEEARRILGLLRMFYPISSEYIENDNTLREFIGGSIYEN